MRHLPAFAARYSLHPWDIDRLTLLEFDVYAHCLGGGDDAG